MSKGVWLSLVFLALAACGDSGEAGGGGAGGAAEGGAAEGGAGGAGGEEPQDRVALRLQARADVVERGNPSARFVRLVVPVDAPLEAAADKAQWAVMRGGESALSAGASVFVFPAIADPSTAAFAVWLLPNEAEGTFSISFAGGEPLELVAQASDVLGSVTVQPLIVRDPDGGGPSQSSADIEARMAGFSELYARDCNIELVVRPAVDVTVEGFATVAPQDLFSIDDAETIQLVSTGAGGEVVDFCFSTNLLTLLDALADASPADPTVVRAAVVGEFQSPETAATLTPAVFHLDAATELYGVSPYYFTAHTAFTYDLSQPLFDETTDPPTMAQQLVPVDVERVFTTFFGEDHVEAFGHELGHILGLPHPQGSSVIDAGNGDSLMDPADECLPDCDTARITPHQCEIMLTGLTGYLK